jgi:hypothetical protein
MFSEGAQRYTIVKTRSGSLGGHLSDDISVFKGVRFADPPFGANRLRPPHPLNAGIAYVIRSRGEIREAVDSRGHRRLDDR